jgi:hypothetical protein
MTAFKATYSDFKVIRGRKVAQIILEVPLEQADEALTVLGGVPRPDQERWVGVARIDPNAAKAAPEVAGEPTPPKGGKYAKRAGIVCNEPGFWTFITEIFPQARHHGNAAEFVRSYCGVKSRSDLDHNEEAQRRFRGLVADYEFWRQT